MGTSQEILLKKTPYLLKEVEVSDVQTVLNDEDIYILDYEFMDSLLVVLGYYSRYNKSSLFLIGPYGDTISKLRIEGKAEGLEHDCFNRLQLHYPDKSYLIERNGPLLDITFKGFFQDDGLELPCRLLYQDKMITSFHVKNQLLAYAYIGLADSVFHYFKIVDNQGVLYEPTNWGLEDDGRKYNFEFLNKLDGCKLPAAPGDMVINHPDLYASAGPDPASIYQNTHYDNNYLLNLHYFKNVIDKAVYVPVYEINDQMYLFNHVFGRIEVFDESLEEIKKVPVDYYKNRGWERKLIFDRKEKRVFALFKKGGRHILWEINPENGQVLNKTEIPFAFVRQIKVHGGFAYFLYREEDYYATDRKVVKLYKVKL